MKELLDLKNKKKVDIIEIIYNSKNHSCVQEVILKELNITYPTLRSLIGTINNDVLRFGHENFSIIHSPSNQLYTLIVSEENSVQLIIHAYIKDSPKFQLLELLLTSSFNNLQSIADKLYISYPSIRKDIKELNKLLEKYRVHISTNNGIRLEGDELGIRLYYTFLYLTVYGGESWPFLFIRYFEITELLEKCPKEIYNAHFLDKNMLVHFYLAVHLLRVRQNNYLPSYHQFHVPLYNAYSDESKKSYEVFLNDLSNYLPNVNEETLVFTTRIILSVLLAFGSYSSIDKVPSFFYSEPAFQKNRFLFIVSFTYEKIEQHLSIPLSNSEKEKLLYSFMCVNYRYLLFKNLSLNLESMVLGYTNIEKNLRKAHKVKHLKLLVSQLMELEEFSVFEPYKKELSSDYLIILEKRIDFSKHTLPVKVAILSIISNDTAVFDFMSIFSNYYNVCVTDKLDDDIDLVISDFSLSDQVLDSFSINQPIVYVNTRWSETDYEKVNRKLADITEANFINKVD